MQTAIDIQRAIGISPGMPGAQEAVATGATDANPGVVRKIPSIAIGDGGWPVPSRIVP